ncbi:hypothetical protein ACFW2V_12335 [Streptomyces sp. NPDC058947]|uniref:hypothetical protein n=1 Tax=Streptomyces sp. NPDC058947 TaxID=3346675 RepID=UPI00367CD439
MTANHARAIEVAALCKLVEPVRLKRHDALKILAHDEATRGLLMDAINTFQGVTTYASALQVVQTEPRYKVLCEACGWSLEMICPECAKGCGCETSCTGWRHGELGYGDGFEGDEDGLVDYGEEFGTDEPYEEEPDEDWYADDLFGEPQEEPHWG